MHKQGAQHHKGTYRAGLAHAKLWARKSTLGRVTLGGRQATESQHFCVLVCKGPFSFKAFKSLVRIPEYRKALQLAQKIKPLNVSPVSHIIPPTLIRLTWFNLTGTD